MTVSPEVPLGLPPMTSAGTLPIGKHPGTLDEIEQRFVTEAPFKQERAQIMLALRLYASRVWGRFPDATLWVNGGFVTHKTWAAPSDVDVAVLMPEGSPQLRESDESLWTHQSITKSDGVTLERLQPVAGLVDGFLVPAQHPSTVMWWAWFWQRRKEPGLPDVLFGKGFVEVSAP